MMTAHALILRRIAASCTLCSAAGFALAQATGAVDDAQATRLFRPIQEVLQHPRCQNCHIPGDAPLQYDAGLPHQMMVRRGPDGHGTAALPCESCHQSKNPDPALGDHAPPGAPTWHLPPENMKMVFIGLSPGALCATITDKARNGGKDVAAIGEHLISDPLVDWGWNPGGNRAPVPISKPAFMSAVKAWMAAGSPCPKP